MSDEEQRLFEDLRAVRRQFADAEGVPAFVIVGDRVLREIAAWGWGEVRALLGH